MTTLPTSEITEETLLTQLNWRYATKRFDPTKKIPASTWATLLEAIRLSPSSFGLQMWKAIVVENPELRQKLQAHSWHQPQIVEASHLVIFAAKTNLGTPDVDALIKRIIEVRAVPAASLADYRAMMQSSLDARRALLTTWATKQAYIALGNLLTSAALLGVDACPMEGFDAPAYDQLLNLPAQNLTASVVATLGYRAAIDKHADDKKVRLVPEDVFIRV